MQRSGRETRIPPLPRGEQSRGPRLDPGSAPPTAWNRGRTTSSFILVAGLTLGRGDREGYLLAMQRDAGVVGRLLAHGVVDHLVPPIWDIARRTLLTAEVLDHADGVICHSRYVERLADYGYTGPIAVVPHPAGGDELGPAWLGGSLSRPSVRRVPRMLQRVPQLLRRSVACFAGHPTQCSSSRGRGGGCPARRRAPRGRRARLDHLDERELRQLLADCDVCVSLRSADHGRDVWDGHPRALAG